MNRAKLRIFVCAIILVGLCSYSAIIGPRSLDSLREALAQPALAAGLELRLGPSVKVVDVHPRAFVIRQRGAQIAVRIPDPREPQWVVWKQPLEVGDHISLRGTFHPEGYLVLHDMHIHSGRRLKIGVSVLALMLLAGMLIYERMKAPSQQCPTSSHT